MKTINVDLFIEYDDDKETIEYYNIGGYHTIREMAVIFATFKKMLNEFGYEVIRNNK